ncbi:MAG: ATP-binding cassette domain-containing protein [Treponema sp.]|jgi:ABC-2 type transport system ATP-binding protein|nr:ATP-binding cassette domain-containing protein [Treponema sp.]
MNDYVLRTKDLGKKYGNVYALEKVNVEIKRGDIYGLIGLNGAGKTTFMRAVTGLLFPSAGVVELFGETGEAALRRGRERIGQSIETPALYPNMSAVQNLEIQCIVSGVSNRDTVKKTLETVGLSDTGNKEVKNFSLGMKQRLGLAIALAGNPEFLILDEPMNGLDPKGIIEMRALMRSLVKERGLTLLVSSHLLDELAQVATRYGIIDKGRLVRQLSTEELRCEMRRHIRIVTENPAKAMELLKHTFNITKIETGADGELLVYEHSVKTGEINTLLATHGVVVESITVAEQRLEDYFVKITGGNL